MRATMLFALLLLCAASPAYSQSTFPPTGSSGTFPPANDGSAIPDAAPTAASTDNLATKTEPETTHGAGSALDREDEAGARDDHTTGAYSSHSSSASTFGSGTTGPESTGADLGNTAAGGASAH